MTSEGYEGQEVERRPWTYHIGSVGHFKDSGFYSEPNDNLRQSSLKEFEIWLTSVNLSEASQVCLLHQSNVILGYLANRRHSISTVYYKALPILESV